MELSPSAGSDFRILIVRPDRIGDVLLSTPVIAALKQHYPNARITLMTREFVRHAVENIPGVDEWMAYEPDGRHKGIKGFFALIREVRLKDFRIALVLHSHFKLAAAIYGAGVRYRIGPFSKPHSYLFFNRGLRQKRSHVEMHEADYNLQLLRRLGIRALTRQYPLQVSIEESTKVEVAEWLKNAGMPEGDMIVVHPGMGGSALNWPETHYSDLILALAKEGKNVVVTGGPTELHLLERIEKSLGKYSNRIVFFKNRGERRLDFLIGILDRAKVVVAPSTGPMHLAVALNKPVVTFFPPIRVQSAIRWGPYTPSDERASILVPEAYCGEEFTCRGSVCHFFPCMKSIPVSLALHEVERQIKLEK